MNEVIHILERAHLQQCNACQFPVKQKKRCLTLPRLTKSCLSAILSATSGPPITSTAQLLVYSSHRHCTHSTTTTQSRSHVIFNIRFSHCVYVIGLVHIIHLSCRERGLRFIASSTQLSRDQKYLELPVHHSPLSTSLNVLS